MRGAISRVALVSAGVVSTASGEQTDIDIVVVVLLLYQHHIEVSPFQFVAFTDSVGIYIYWDIFGFNTYYQYTYYTYSIYITYYNT